MSPDPQPLDAGQRAAVALITVALDSALAADHAVDHAAIDLALEDAGGWSGGPYEVIAWHTAVVAALLIREGCEEGGDPRRFWQRFVAGLAVSMEEDA